MYSLPSVLSRGFLPILAFLLFAASPIRSQLPPAPSETESPQPPSPPQCESAEGAASEWCDLGDLHLRHTSYVIAQDICSSDLQQASGREHCLLPLLRKLGNMPEADRCGTRKLDELLLRQRLTSMILTASLEVDGFLGQVDSESNHLREVKDQLTARQNAAINRSTFGNDIGTGGGAVGSALALGAKTATAGSWVGAVFGGIGAVFGFVGYSQSSKSPKGCFPASSDGACVPFQCPRDAPADRGCSPSMLYHLFHQPDRAAKPEDQPFHSNYDPVIQKYLDKRNDQLMEGWKEKGHAEFPADTVAKLTAFHRTPMKLSIDDLTDRQNKLSDLRALVARINRDLSRLSDDLATGLSWCSDSEGN